MKKLFLAIMLCSTALMAQSNPDRFGGGGPLINSGTLATGDRTCIRLGAGEATVGYTLIGISSATVTFAGTTKRPLDATSLKLISTATTDGLYRVDVASYSYICAVLTAGATQSILVVWETSTAVQASAGGGSSGGSVIVTNDGGTPVSVTTPGWHVLWDYIGDGGTVTSDGGSSYWSPIIDTGGISEWYVQRTGQYSGTMSWSALNPTDAGTLPPEVVCGIGGGHIGTWDVACSDKTNLCMHNDAGGCSTPGEYYRPMLNGIIFQVGAGAGPGSELQVIGR